MSDNRVRVFTRYSPLSKRVGNGIWTISLYATREVLVNQTRDDAGVLCFRKEVFVVKFDVNKKPFNSTHYSSGSFIQDAPYPIWHSNARNEPPQYIYIEAEKQARELMLFLTKETR